MKYEDIQNKCDDGPEESVYVEQIIERESTTCSGEHEIVPDRTFNTKMFATDGPAAVPWKYLKNIWKDYRLK